MIREIFLWWERVEQRVQRIQPPQARRIVIAVLGFTLLLLGVVLIVLPGPASLVIPAGLAILALEFEWARVWLARVKRVAEYVARKTGPITGSRFARKATRKLGIACAFTN